MNGLSLQAEAGDMELAPAASGRMTGTTEDRDLLLNLLTKWEYRDILHAVFYKTVS